MDILMIVVMFLIGFFQALMGTTITGGGIIAIPALIAIGLPAHVALGTIRPSYLAGALLSSFRFKAKGYKLFKEGIIMIIPAFVGAFIGASLILEASETLTKYLIAAVVFVSIVLISTKKEAGIVKTKEKHSIIILVLIALGIGILSGAVGVVGGTISMAALVIFEGFTFKEAVVLNNIRAIGNQTAALIVFALASSINWEYAIVVMLGSLVGAFVGVEIIHKTPIIWLKPVFIAVAILLVIKFLFF